MCGADAGCLAINYQSLAARATAPPAEKQSAALHREPGSASETKLPGDHFTEMCSGSKTVAYLRLIDSCITQLKAQGPSRTCNESKEEEEEASIEESREVGREGANAAAQATSVNNHFAEM